MFNCFNRNSYYLNKNTILTCFWCTDVELKNCFVHSITKWNGATQWKGGVPNALLSFIEGGCRGGGGGKTIKNCVT